MVGLNNPENPGPLRWLASALNELLGVPEAKAWTGPAEEADQVHFFHTDHLGSTRLVTDKQGQVFEAIDYAPFGEILSDRPWGGLSDYERRREKFTGQVWDYFTKLYYYGARYYDPELGRFAQPDTVVPEPLSSQAFNRYSYVGNNPFKFIDPTGHFFFSGLLGKLGLAVGSLLGGLLGAGLGARFGLVGMVVGGAVLSGVYARSFALGGARLGYEIDRGLAQAAGVEVQVISIVSQLAAIVGIGWGFGRKKRYLATSSQECGDYSIIPDHWPVGATDEEKVKEKIFRETQDLSMVNNREAFHDQDYAEMVDNLNISAEEASIITIKLLNEWKKWQNENNGVYSLWGPLSTNIRVPYISYTRGGIVTPYCCAGYADSFAEFAVKSGKLPKEMEVVTGQVPGYHGSHNRTFFKYKGKMWALDPYMYIEGFNFGIFIYGTSPQYRP